MDADQRLALDPDAELSTLIALRRPQSDGTGALFNDKRYVALVYDAEPDARAVRSPQWLDAIIALAQSLNAHTRCAAVALRGYGNGSGADSVFTANTGYPTAIDFARGYPQYRPHEVGNVDVVLVVGERGGSAYRSSARGSIIAVGADATHPALGSTAVAIDAGAAAIHTSGTAVRADDVPVPLRASLQAPRSVSDVLHALLAAVR